MKRLRTDHVDIYLLHQFDDETPVEETVRALDDLVTSGKTRYIGACNFAAWQVCKFLWTADRVGRGPASHDTEPVQPAEPELGGGDVWAAAGPGARSDGLQPAGRGTPERALHPGPGSSAGARCGRRRTRRATSARSPGRVRGSSARCATLRQPTAKRRARWR